MCRAPDYRIRRAVWVLGKPDDEKTMIFEASLQYLKPWDKRFPLKAHS
jgi:hypothetical protein